MVLDGLLDLFLKWARWARESVKEGGNRREKRDGQACFSGPGQ
jgi:hypothetical protein